MSSLCALMRNLTLSRGIINPGSCSLSPKSLLAIRSDILAGQQNRSMNMRAARRIRGYPRPLVSNIVRPEPMKYGYRLIKPDEYTTDALRIKKLAGRDPVTKRVVVRTIGGGVQKYAYWVDFMRDGPEDGVFEEKVYKIEYDGIMTCKVALVANGEKKRWIVATEGVEVGSIISTTRHIPKIPVRPREGDAHPLGALPVATQVHCVEKIPGMGGQLCRAAGASAQILRKVEGRVIIQLPSKLHMSLSEKCLGVVGQVSNADRNETFYPIGSPNRLRRIGKRPRTGFWHRKDGYCGRKIKPPPPLKVIPLAKSRKDSEFIL
ncbi:39S ribosomal protein L2, mitochondrial [Galendromus occidentalis]|uniref:39S ribosomal protein L2, mitochondrial n=1 Tax=Galendromus occidentalis TaxID=34638 RepID=A0AAJ6QMJ8_9ACAR|nr:39S ribosomal protein L2, mitochondrial [Galendromus occidentalis]